MIKIKKLQIGLVAILVFVVPQVNAESYSAKESCLHRTYQKAMEFYNDNNWLGTVAFTQAAIECARVTNFREDPKGLFEELRSVNKFAINKIRGKQVKGTSLTTPRLSGRLPRMILLH